MTGAGRPPVLFLGVDGVIATFVDTASDYSAPRVNWTRDKQARVRYNPAVTGWIRELASLAEVRWHRLSAESRHRPGPALGSRLSTQ